jgi:predicted nucleic acid-binding Zn ribbon protein
MSHPKKSRTHAHALAAAAGGPVTQPPDEASGQGPTKSCILCGERIALSARKCTHCNVYQDRPLKSCNDCGEAIPSDADKCTHCDTFQDWRRYLNFSTTMVALITALISVVASSLPAVRELVIGDRSDMTLNFQRVENAKILLLGSNSGTRPGAVNRAKLTLSKGKDQREIPLKGSWHEVSPNDSKGFEVLGPGKSALFVLDVKSELLPNEQDTVNIGDYTCLLEIVTAEFDRANKTIPIKKPCQDLRTVLQDRIPKLPRTP